MQWCAVYALSVLGAVMGCERFQDAIPNGHNVVNPCDLDGARGQPWPGVGHRKSTGGGARNPFGHDWAKNGLVN